MLGIVAGITKLRVQVGELLEPSKMGTYVTYPYLEQLHGYRALDT
jgi:hypothetical protein